MTDRKHLQGEYASIVADLGPWAEPFGLHPGGKVTGTGSATPGRQSPTIVCADVAVYREGPNIFVHKRLPGRQDEAVFIFEVLPEGGSKMVLITGEAGAPGAPTASMN